MLTAAARRPGAAPHVLHGMGGSGKTALAAEVFLAAQAAGLTALWVVAADRAGLRRGMLAVAAELGAEPAELLAAHDGRLAASDLVWRYLARTRGWFLVIDKADSPELLDGWLRLGALGGVSAPSGAERAGGAEGTGDADAPDGPSGSGGAEGASGSGGADGPGAQNGANGPGAQNGANGSGGAILPGPTGAILITTRRARAPQWQNATLHRLDVLPPEDAARVITDFAPGRGTAKDALDLANRLGRLPLALRLAGSYLERQALETWSLNDYRARFERDGTALADQGAELPFVDDAGGPSTESELRQRLSWTWQITLDDLAARGLPEAATLMRLLSCWSPAPLPRDVLSGLTAAGASSATEAALRALIDNSLVSAHSYVAPGPDATVTPCLQAHGLVLESVHAGIDPEERPGYLRTAVRLLDEALPGDSSPAHAGRLRLLVPHTAAVLHHADRGTSPQAAALGIRTAQLICEAGDYRAAVELATLTGDVSQRLHGPDHHDTMTARHHQGDYLRRLGDYHGAEEVLRRVHGRRAEVLGARHRETLETAAALSMTLYLLGRAEESLTWIRRAIDGQRRTLGNDHVETLRSRAYALEFLAHSGRTETFLRDGPATIVDAERSLGADHVVTAIAYSNYAYGLLRTDAPAEAKVAAAERALHARVRLYGDGHPLVLSAKLVLSWARSLSGAHEPALALMREAVDGRERILGELHPLTVKARVLYAERLAEAGHADRALGLLRDNLPQAEAIYGPHDLDIQRATALQERLTTP
ncbi:tetratricopeptide repeat protein [Actinacidiphila sp. DG2A-62]|uniref:tetratricopeptide repeat protein n=1 Tax=Actinacidiphila sp. DG2A-62 TaxID=3108821 RepID=UPI002DBEE519|nr:tetratricopeptide repeat protein [Actinacidiphila sp. DG2A-62]MEC3995864.1 tetratricopeptide repeat protein [Actinacidiphila sp. DG2A-62]